MGTGAPAPDNRGPPWGSAGPPCARAVTQNKPYSQQPWRAKQTQLARCGGLQGWTHRTKQGQSGPVVGREPGAGCAKQSQLGRLGRREIRNSKLEMRNKSETRMTQTSKPIGRRMASNKPNFCLLDPKRRIKQRDKANPGRGDLGMDDELRIVDDLETQTPAAAPRRTKPLSLIMCPEGPAEGTSGENALRRHYEPNKQSQFRPAGAARVKQTQSGPVVGREPGPRAKQTQFGSRRPRRDAEPMAPNKPNLAGRTGAPRQTKPIPLPEDGGHGPPYRAVGNQRRQTKPICQARRPNSRAPARQTKPISRRARLTLTAF